MEVPIAEPKQQLSPFWRFSLRLYPIVADTCLELQDGFGVDVNVLLFLLWAAHNNRKVGPGEVHFIVSAVDNWTRSAVAPLRGVRRFLRSPPEVIESGAAAKLRQRIKEIELEAERLEQEALYRLMPVETLGVQEPSREAAARANLDLYAAKLRTAFPGILIEALLTGFRQLDRVAQDQPGER